MGVFVPTYLQVLEMLLQWGKGKRRVVQQQVDVFRSLPAEARVRLEEGEYPPYHFVRAAARAAGVPVEACKNWLQGFLYWRTNSLQLKQVRPGVEPGEP
jgi:hypothetical protein